MTIDDLEPYRPYIDNFDLTEEQKLELLNTLEVMARVVLDRHFKDLMSCD
ncbi:hypothetical protein N9W34_00485 [Rickettsiales bacterium]|nr:hypothetical protein [Rickettsiales bacterium]